MFQTSLVSASGSPIRSWGFQRHTVQFDPLAFTFNFLLADVARPILGFDFLRTHRLNVSPSSRVLRFAASARPGEPAATVAAAIPPPLGMVSNEILQKIPADIQKLLAEFPGILRGENAPPAPTHGVEHIIKTSGHPIFSKARRLDSEKLNVNFNTWRS